MVGLQPIPGDGDHALLLTQDGIIRRANLADDAAAPTVFLDIRDRLIQSPGPEQGLLGLAFAPDYPASGRFYIYYTAGPPMKNTISRFVARGDAAELASERILLQINQPFQNHNGGSLAFGPDGYLYAGIGDGGSAGDPSGYGQRFDTLHGKILRIDVSGDAYTIPPDNPFAGQDARGEIYAYGLRNPWRMNFDQATGQLWTGDVGQNAWRRSTASSRAATTVGTAWKVRIAMSRRTVAMRRACCSRASSTATSSAARSPAASYTAAARCRN